MRLVRCVHPDALEGAPARRAGSLEQPGEVHVASERECHEVGHYPAAGQNAEAPRSVADEVTQPAHDLLLDEGARWPGVPDVDALLRHLGKELADDGHP